MLNLSFFFFPGGESRIPPPPSLNMLASAQSQVRIHLYFYVFFLHANRHMINTVVGGVMTLNDIICKPVTTHGQGEVIIK